MCGESRSEEQDLKEEKDQKDEKDQNDAGRARPTC
jgi:hypothetical protein